MRVQGIQPQYSREISTIIQFLRCRVEKDDEGLIQAICDAYGVPGFRKILCQTTPNELDFLLEDISLKLKEEGIPDSLWKKLERAILNNNLDDEHRWNLNKGLGGLELVNKAIDLVKNR